MRITYRSLQLLNTIFLETGGKMLYPMHWFILKMVTFLGGTLIKHGSKMEPIVFYILSGWVLFGIISWAACLELAGRLHLYSGRAINSWKYHDWGEDHREMLKFKRSCKPLTTSYHTLFSIKRTSVLKFFKSVGRTMFKAITAL
ncbi:unnamed protein product [Orchesella dallaii]|uniref:Uncharacterized protein n=1 Tax=Orchesella dallaii TaxID=48710 RepID=A0ABP1S6M9_9HEXA